MCGEFPVYLGKWLLSNKYSILQS